MLLQQLVILKKRKLAVRMQDIQKKIFGELSTHVARINGCSNDCCNLGILQNNSVPYEI